MRLFTNVQLNKTTYMLFQVIFQILLKNNCDIKFYEI